MSDSSSYSNTSDLDDIHNIDLVMQLINQDQQVQGESSRRSRNAINRFVPFMLLSFDLGAFVIVFRLRLYVRDL
ncbi:hypothetical protein Tco_1183483 [Tanacetum coccineum]